ncbi:Detected protein of unknown function [Hibiscus syriacus]|uniref:Uncharacterized protein n=1 Tax=Hibiscus syriacus TaxID=106335 RepID=A0A6A3D5P0_HIBSY|nr:Detected protein of unknown function [Hibiscus syriacus]
MSGGDGGGERCLKFSNLLGVTFRGERRAFVNRVSSMVNEWNKGVGDDFPGVVRSLIVGMNPSFLFIQESKVDSVQPILIRRLMNDLAEVDPYWSKHVWLGVALMCGILCWQVSSSEGAVKVELLKCVSGLRIFSAYVCVVWSCMGAILWSIRKCRNGIIFEKGKLDSTHLFFLTRYRLSAWFSAKFPNVSIPFDCLVGNPSLADSWSSCKKVPSLPSVWDPPPPGFYTVNVDGAMDMQWFKGGIGGLLRDVDGNVLGTLSEIVGSYPPIMDELLEIKAGLWFFEESGWGYRGHLILESNYANVLNWIKNPGSCSALFESLVKEIVTIVLDRNVIEVVSLGWLHLFLPGSLADSLIDLIISQHRIRELTGVHGTHAGGGSHEKDRPSSGILMNQNPHGSTAGHGFSPTNQYPDEQHHMPPENMMRYMHDNDYTAKNLMFNDLGQQRLSNGTAQEFLFNSDRGGPGTNPDSAFDRGFVRIGSEDTTNDVLYQPDEMASQGSEDNWGCNTGEKLLGCGFPVRGTTLCMFQWVRHLQDGTRQYIEGATNPEYVVTADDVDKLIAVECIPMDDQGRQGEIVRLFANDQNKIKCGKSV